MSVSTTARQVSIAPGPEPAGAVLQLERGARVLLMADPRRAAGLKARTPGATVITSLASLDGMQAPFDAAVIDGLLEHERWDRWVLQRIHGLLRNGGSLTVVVPPLTSLASAADLRFLAYAARQLLVRAVKHWRAGWDLVGPVRRRYHLAGLVRKMESLGYTQIEPGAGWGKETIAGDRWLAQRATLTARKTASMPGVQGRAWPEEHLVRRRYAEQFAGMRAARQAWLSAWPGFAPQTARALVPSEWRNARVLVLSPHPDDELIGCGGTLCRILRAGAEVAILHATDGRRLESLRGLPLEFRQTVRLEEAARVAAALGARLILWRREDGRLRCSGDAIAELSRVLRELRPTHVFTPFLGDRHADHQCLSRILGEAIAHAPVEPWVLQYEVWSLVPANLYCGITQEAQELERLLLLYERAMQVEDFVHFCETRNLARAFELTGKPGYVEAFLCTTGVDYRRLAGETANNLAEIP